MDKQNLTKDKELIIKTFRDLETRSELSSFLEDLLTEDEFLDLAQRIKIANEFISPSKIGHMEYSYPDFAKVPKVESRKESIFWGVRWLYYKVQYLNTDKSGALITPYIRKWYTWPQAVKFYNGNPELSDKYVSEVISVYEKGIDSKGNKLW